MRDPDLTERLKEAAFAKKNKARNFEDEDFTKEDWQEDVANGDTLQGYFDWVIYNLKSWKPEIYL